MIPRRRMDRLDRSVAQGICLGWSPTNRPIALGPLAVCNTKNAAHLVKCAASLEYRAIGHLAINDGDDGRSHHD